MRVGPEAGGRRRSRGGAAVPREARLARGHAEGRGVANSHEDVVDERPAAGPLQHVVDPVLQAAVALVRGRGALAAGGARAGAQPREGRARRQGAAQEAKAARGAAPARLALFALHCRERHQLRAGGVPGRGTQAEAARGGLGHGRRRAGGAGARARSGAGARSGRSAAHGSDPGPEGRPGAGAGGGGSGPGRGRGRALGAWGPPEPALTARFPGDWGCSFRLQLSYYALHAARLSTCHRRAPLTCHPPPPRPSPARPTAAFPNREGAREQARRGGGRGRAEQAAGQGARAAELVPGPNRLAGAARGAGKSGACKRCPRLRGAVGPEGQPGVGRLVCACGKWSPRGVVAAGGRGRDAVSGEV